MPGSTRREPVMPAVVVELLRLCVVMFLAGLGYLLGTQIAPDGEMLGPLDGVTAGIVLGAALGYVFGGVVARLTGRTLQEAEQLFRQRSIEQILAGMVGAVIGILFTAGLLWPVLLLGPALITLPIFVFGCVAVGTLGHRVGSARRDDLIAVLGPRAGLAGKGVDEPARLLDTSVAIDARIVDVVRAGFLRGPIVVPQPVLDELRGLADSADDLRRAKGRRGLDALEALGREKGVTVEVIGDEAMELPEVDAKLVRIALDRGIALLTLDSGLAKAAGLAGCRVMNLHALSLALRPPVSAGDDVTVLLTRVGKEAGQAVGYLDDGTMVVVEGARELLGASVPVVVSSVMTTANGRLVFAKRAPAETPAGPRAGTRAEGAVPPKPRVPAPAPAAAPAATPGPSPARPA
ncbi:PIN/TRAM domain-containing protein [Spongisporangium articulatum]|uniref:PIN/TRAM domain-containing protein n=1 Tax=Spongisporangium articulatum TaxID=3362603 RepID=A0ABW8AJT6_9ACTN